MGKLQQHHVVASKVGKCQFIFTAAAAAAYFTAFARSPDRHYYITQTDEGSSFLRGMPPLLLSISIPFPPPSPNRGIFKGATVVSGG